MAKNEKKNDIAKMGFEGAIKELTGIVGKIEKGIPWSWPVIFRKWREIEGWFKDE